MNITYRALFEFSSSLPLDLKIKQNPPKSCQIIGGEGGVLAGKAAKKWDDLR